MNCTKLDGFDVQTTTEYDAFGNVISRETKKVARADVPIVLSPPGTCEDDVAFEWYFDALAPATDEYETRLEEMGFGPGDSNLYRYSVSQVEDAVGLQYHAARHYDPTIGRWLSQDPVGFEAGDSNLFRYCEPGPGEFLKDR
jgi:RHS repeat-associated protein